MRFLAGTFFLLTTAGSLLAQQSVAPSSAAIPQASPSATGPASPAQTSLGSTQAITPQPTSSVPSSVSPGGQSTASAQTSSGPAQAATSLPPSATASPATASKPASSSTVTVLVPTPTKREIAEAKRQFEAGVKLQLEGAYGRGVHQVFQRVRTRSPQR